MFILGVKFLTKNYPRVQQVALLIYEILSQNSCEVIHQSQKRYLISNMVLRDARASKQWAVTLCTGNQGLPAQPRQGEGNLQLSPLLHGNWVQPECQRGGGALLFRRLQCPAVACPPGLSPAHAIWWRQGWVGKQTYLTCTKFFTFVSQFTIHIQGAYPTALLQAIFELHYPGLHLLGKHFFSTSTISFLVPKLSNRISSSCETHFKEF